MDKLLVFGLGFFIGLISMGLYWFSWWLARKDKQVNEAIDAEAKAWEQIWSDLHSRL